MSVLKSDPRTAAAVCTSALHRRIEHVGPLLLGLLGPRERVAYLAQVDDLYKPDVFVVTDRRLLYLRDLGARGFRAAVTLSVPCRVRVNQGALGATVTVTGAEGDTLTFLTTDAAALEPLRGLARPRPGRRRPAPGTTTTQVLEPVDTVSLARATGARSAEEEEVSLSPHVGSLERRLFRVLSWSQQVSEAARSAAAHSPGAEQPDGQRTALTLAQQAVRSLGDIESGDHPAEHRERLLTAAEERLRAAAGLLGVQLR